jgi:transcription elongation factor GreA
MRLTPQAHERLKNELEKLTTEALPAARALIDDSRTAGDIGQNPDYFLAAEEEGNVLARIKRIETALAAHEAAAGEPAPGTDSVQVGVVVVLDFAGDREEYYVGPIEEAHGGVDVLTPESALGKALLGQPAGAAVSLNGMNVVVVEIKEAA